MLITCLSVLYYIKYRYSNISHCKIFSKIIITIKVPLNIPSANKNVCQTDQERKSLSGYEMVSFDVTSLFTNEPLDKTIEIILKRDDKKKEIANTIQKREIKEFIYLCTKNVNLSLNNEYTHKMMA